MEHRSELTLFFFFAVLPPRPPSLTEHPPAPDAETIADALRAGPNFITDGATFVDYPASTGLWVPGASGGEFHVGPHIMAVAPHPEDLQGFASGGRNGRYTIRLPGPDQADSGDE